MPILKAVIRGQPAIDEKLIIGKSLMDDRPDVGINSSAPALPEIKT
jgi:hypothetical protein